MTIGANGAICSPNSEFFNEMKYTDFESKFAEKCANNGVFDVELNEKVDMYVNYVFSLTLPIPKYEVKFILDKIREGDLDTSFLRDQCAQRGYEMTPMQVKLGLAMYEIALEEMLEK